MVDSIIDAFIVGLFASWFFGYCTARKIWYGRWLGYNSRNTKTQESQS